MIAPKKWATDASDAVLIRMWTARYTSVAIGAVLGVTARQAANRAQRLRKQGRLAARRNGWYDKHSVAAVIDDGPWPGSIQWSKDTNARFARYYSGSQGRKG